MDRPLTEKEELRLELNEVKREKSKLRHERDRLRDQLTRVNAGRDLAVKFVREYLAEFGGRELVLHDGYVPNVDGKDCEQLMDMVHAAEAILANLDAENKVSEKEPSLPPGWAWKTSKDSYGETYVHPARTSDGKEVQTYMGAWEIHRTEGEVEIMNEQEKISDEDWAKAAEDLISDFREESLESAVRRLECKNEELRRLLKESKIYKCRCCNSYKAKGLPGPDRDGCANCGAGEGDMVLIEDPGMLIMELEAKVKKYESRIEQVSTLEKEPEGKLYERVPVQAQHDKPAGTIAWSEHVLIWEMYAEKNGAQTAERIAERGGFGYSEACNLLGRDLETWEPR